MLELILRENMNPKIYYYKNGKIQAEHYYFNNKYHRVDGPAIINYHENGKIQSKYYYINGKCHRTDGSAITSYYKNGKIRCQYYCLNNKSHRVDGPAEIYFYINGKTEYEYYDIVGVEYSKQDYIKLINEIKQLSEGVRLTDNRKWVRQLGVSDT